MMGISSVQQDFQDRALQMQHEDADFGQSTVPFDFGLQRPFVGVSGEGEWTNAVMDLVPFLSADQLAKALAILDRAILNTQQAKVVQQMLDEASATQVPTLTLCSLIHSATQMQHQLFEQQQSLLDELHHLRAMVLLENATRALLLQPIISGSQNSTVSSTMDLPQMDSEAPNSGSRQGGRRPAKTLSDSLELLSTEDPRCLLIIRRINKLGFKADRKLKQFFSTFGVVVKVLCAHSSVRPSAAGQAPQPARKRPSSLGFLQMATAESVAEILKLDEYQIDGFPIKVQKFERHHGEAAAAEAAAAEAAEGEIYFKQDPCVRGLSTASTVAESFGNSSQQESDF